ncbi:MAG TPA: hypothetical protein DCE80_17150 [Ignavibacteriales bacterium]|nr:hypothetical protein [Ignavibacteriales bacterium]
MKSQEGIKRVLQEWAQLQVEEEDYVLIKYHPWGHGKGLMPEDLTKVVEEEVFGNFIVRWGS